MRSATNPKGFYERTRYFRCKNSQCFLLNAMRTVWPRTEWRKTLINNNTSARYATLTSQIEILSRNRSFSVEI
jgi:hypothetical protein